MKISYLSIVLLGLFTGNTASAQQKLSLTVDECVEIGLRDNKGLHASLMKVQSAEARVNEVRATRLPSLRFSGGYTRLSAVAPFEISLPLPPPAQGEITISPSILDTYNLRLTLQQPLFTGFRLQSSVDIAGYNAEATQKDYNRDRAELLYAIKNAYWSLFKAVEFKRVVDENVEQVKAHLKDVHNFFTQGMATNNEVLKVQVQLSNVQLLQISAKNGVRLAMGNLNNLIGLPLDTEIHPASRLERQPEDVEELPRLVQRALENRPEVKGMEHRLKAGEAGVTLARSGRFPQVFLTGNYSYARPNSRILPAKERFNGTWDVGVALSLDIWNWRTTARQVDQAESQFAQIRDALGQLKDGITLEVTQTYLSLLEARERIAVAEQGVRQAEENYRITGEQFKTGVVLNTDLLDAEVALLQAKTNETQALVDYELAQARLQKALGE